MTGVSDVVSNPGLLQTAHALEVDRVTSDVVKAFQDKGVRVLLLKGPALASWLYDDGTPRPYIDCDLLVPFEDQGRAQNLLSSLGFVRDTSADHLVPRFGPLHADMWVRPEDRAQVDLHRALSGLRMGGSDVWAPMSEGAQTLKVGRTRVMAPRRAALALTVILHAAHHGPEVPQPLEDLARALERVPDDSWTEVVELADALHALPELTRGLRLLPAGERRADRLALPSAEMVRVALGNQMGSRTALGFERLSTRRGARAKATLLLEELFPSPRFMRWWTGIARRGPTGLALAYGWRMVWLAVNAVPGALAWRRLRASSRS